MHKLLPFRQYDEKDVINLFSLDVSIGAGSEYINLKPGDSAFNNGGNWSGTLVDTAATNKLMTNSRLMAILKIKNVKERKRDRS